MYAGEKAAATVCIYAGEKAAAFSRINNAKIQHSRYVHDNLTGEIDMYCPMEVICIQLERLTIRYTEYGGIYISESCL